MERNTTHINPATSLKGCVYGLSWVCIILFFLSWETTLASNEPLLVKDINTNIEEISRSSNPLHFAEINGVVYFSAADKYHGKELWKTDGTDEGTELVKDINPGGDSRPRFMTPFKDGFVLVAYDNEHDFELWKSDGTEMGTILIKDINPESGGFVDRSFIETIINPGFTVIGNSVYFVANDGTHGWELWKSDGTESGTTLIKDIYPGSERGLFYFRFYVVGESLYFVANDSVHGYELWKSDGTEGGTVMVKDIWPGSHNSEISGITKLNGYLYFGAYDAEGSKGLWKSDGTSEGTIQIADAFASEMIEHNGQLLFRGEGTEGKGVELWKTDGTTSGTVLVKDIVTGSESSEPEHLINVGENVFFLARNSSHERELWITDGTTVGTVRVKSGISETIEKITSLNSILYFQTLDSERLIWRSDGTEEGTYSFWEIITGSGPTWETGYITAAGGLLYFDYDDGVHGVEPWISNGTTEGTSLLKDINYTNSSSSPGALTAVNETLFFTADDGDGYALWKSIKWELSTRKIKNIEPDTHYSCPPIRFNGSFFFVANDGTHGRELWTSDGTPQGTFMLKDINPGGNESFPHYFTVVNDILF